VSHLTPLLFCCRTTSYFLNALRSALLSPPKLLTQFLEVMLPSFLSPPKQAHTPQTPTKSSQAHFPPCPGQPVCLKINLQLQLLLLVIENHCSQKEFPFNFSSNKGWRERVVMPQQEEGEHEL